MNAGHSMRIQRAGSLALLLSFAAVLQTDAAEKLVPADFKQVTDSLGFRWDINTRGQVGDGTSDCFDGGLRLRISNQDFYANALNERQMTADGSEYVLSVTLNGLLVTRRIRIDRTRSGVRYLEILENPGRSTVQRIVELHSNMGSSCSGTITSGGKMFAGTLDKKDIGIVTSSTSSSRPQVMFLVCGQRAPVKPSISVSGDNVHVKYNVSIKPGQTVVIAHWVAQRRGVNAGSVEDLFKSFYRAGRLLKPEIPRKLRRFITNFRRAGGSAVDDVAFALLEPMEDVLVERDIERGENDIMSFGEDGRLTGRLAGTNLVMSTSFGRTSLALDSVALLCGGAGAGRRMVVHLRDGQCLVGKLHAENLKLSSDNGWSIPLTPEKIDVLAMHATGRDGEPPAGAAAFVRSKTGDCLALDTNAASCIKVVTPWGGTDIPLAELRQVSYRRDPLPWYRVMLKDLTHLSVMIPDQTVELGTVCFGPIKMATREILVLASVSDIASDSLDEAPRADEVREAHCETLGGNIIVGELGLEKLTLFDKGRGVELEPKQIKTMERSEEGDSSAAVLFSVETFSGRALTGYLADAVVPIRSRLKTWRIPVQHVIAYRGASPGER